MDRQISRLRELCAGSLNIVFFGGAGVSTESGIPDFRSTDGLYYQKYKYPPETIISRSFFDADPAEFYNFYRDKMLADQAVPNKCHRILAGMEQKGVLQAVITQNIDGLHQKAGSRRVLELHGSIWRNYCMRCRKAFGLESIRGLKTGQVPRCSCGGIIKPDVVLYQEGLDQQVLDEAAALIGQADALIVGGTSLAVYPAAGLVDYYRSNKLILINKTATPLDGRADLVVQGAIGELLWEAFPEWRNKDGI